MGALFRFLGAFCFTGPQAIGVFRGSGAPWYSDTGGDFHGRGFVEVLEFAGGQDHGIRAEFFLDHPQGRFARRGL